ncbi:MAG: tRNA pseudouridine(38-40) synthase TruA [Pirellulaceae bacterium]|nr:tRNA pseudouridine(38-40) synthase TruA [Pirellulaceae bacterium]
MPTFKLTLAYDGTDFVGWQWQPGQRTVQEELEKAIERITLQKTRCVASGRTDAGVHALGQVVGFRSETWLDGPALCKAINAELPEDMVVFEIATTYDDFHPIRDALRKRYRYLIQDGRPRDIFDRRYVWHLYRRLDVEAMAEAAKALVGKHDFVSFQTSGSRRLTTERTVLDLLVERRWAELTDRVVIEVEADGFLYNMVRNIVGTLVEVGKGKQPVTWPAEVIAKRDRRAAGMTAPAQGLYLIGVEYGENSECGLQPSDCGQQQVEDEAELE